MATWWNQVLIQYEDASGKFATTFWSLADQTSAVPAGLTALATAIQACSNAKVRTVQLQTSLHYSGAPVAAPYQSVQDVAHLIGKYGTQTAHYDLIAPKQAVLMPDFTRVDMANSSIVGLVTAMKNVLGTPGGTALSAITRGSRQWAGRRG